MRFTPVILGGFVNGYSIARTLHETYGVSSVLCDTTRRFSNLSSFCTFRLITEPEHETAFLDELLEIGKKIRAGDSVPFVFATNDKWLIPVSKQKKNLEPVFYFPFSAEWDLIRRLIVKEQLYSLCDSLDIPYPRTFLSTRENSDLIPSIDLISPFLVKPSNVVEFVTTFPDSKRNRVFFDRSGLKEYVESAYAKGYKGKFIVQEYIPGGVDNLYTMTTYSDMQGKLKGYSIGHKLTQYPEDAGTITSGKIKFIPEIIPPTKRILESVRFTGITNAEYKYDARDGIYKMIEVNPRPGMWNYSSFKSGVNLFQMTMEEHAFGRAQEVKEGKDGWLWTIVDPGVILEKYRGTDEYETILEMIRNGKVVDPRCNPEENILYRAYYTCSTVKKRLTDYLKSLVKKG